VDKVEPEFGGFAKQEATNILQVLDKMEDISEALLSRFDIFSLIQNMVIMLLLLLCFNNLSMNNYDIPVVI
jgi:hypothetical protein